MRALLPLKRLLQRVRSLRRSARSEDTPGPAVRLGSRVRYQLDGQPPEDRILVRTRNYVPDGRFVCLDTALGLALIGLRAGDSVLVEWLPTVEEELHVIEVFAVPEPVYTADGVVVPFRRRAAPQPGSGSV